MNQHSIVSEAPCTDVWSCVLVGWISTVRLLGDTFEIEGFYIWHMVMAILMCTVWVILFVLTALAFWKGKIFMAKDEDVIKDILEEKADQSRSETSTLAEKPSDSHAHNFV